MTSWSVAAVTRSLATSSTRRERLCHPSRPYLFDAMQAWLCGSKLSYSQNAGSCALAPDQGLQKRQRQSSVSKWQRRKQAPACRAFNARGGCACTPPSRQEQCFCTTRLQSASRCRFRHVGCAVYKYVSGLRQHGAAPSRLIGAGMVNAWAVCKLIVHGSVHISWTAERLAQGVDTASTGMCIFLHFSQACRGNGTGQGRSAKHCAQCSRASLQGFRSSHRATKCRRRDCAGDRACMQNVAGFSILL